MGYTDWICDNQNGNVVGPIAAPEGNPIIALEVREQGGYGVVNFRIGSFFNGELTYSAWVCNNLNGVVKTATVFGETVKGVVAYEQGGYGLVDIGLVYSGGIKWCTGNHSGSLRTLEFKPGSMNGMDGREQGGYGIVNLRCSLE